MTNPEFINLNDVTELKQPKTNIVYFNEKGEGDSKLIEDFAVAKLVVLPFSGMTLYFIKINTETNTTFQPRQHKITAKRSIKRSSDSRLFEFRQVNSGTFEMYITALKDNNDYLHKQVNRNL